MTEVGTWSGGNWTGGGIFYGTVFRFTDGGQGANTHTWPMDVDGRYAVYVRWSAASNRNATADYTVHHADGTTTITHNQQTDGGVWKPLGVYDLESAATHKVVLADTGAGYTIADAILLVPMEIESLLVSADAVKLVANDAEDVLTVHADHLGAPQKMTDDTRTVVWDAAFTPFGEEDSIIGAETNHWRFPGQYADDESGLSYNWHRTYDPAIGRYLQSDPIGLSDGLNTYAYVGSNPVSFVDPTGETRAGVFGGAVEAGVETAMQLALNGGRTECIDWGQVALAGVAGAAYQGVFYRLALVMQKLSARLKAAVAARQAALAAAASRHAAAAASRQAAAAGRAAAAAASRAATAGASTAKAAGRAAKSAGGRKGGSPGTATGGGSGGYQPLYRAVKGPELDDILDNKGAFKNPLGIENKYFATSPEGAASYAKQSHGAFGDGPFTIIETRIPAGSIKPDMKVSVDAGGISTVTVPTELLPTLAPGRPLNMSPIP